MSRSKQKAETVPAEPLFRWFEEEKGRRARFSREAHYSSAVVTNWRVRGIPRAEVSKVAAHMGLTEEAYRAEAGAPIVPPPSVLPVGLPKDEAELLRDYRRSSDGWKLTLRLMARTPPADQPTLSRDMNILMTTIFGPPADDEHVARAIGPLPKLHDTVKKK